MSWGMRVNFLSVRSYDEAKNRYHNTKPVRGHHDDLRPLGVGRQRSNYHLRIVKIDDAYALRLYNTNVVTYYPDGKVEFRTGGYHSIATSEFLLQCLPNGWCCSRINGRIHVYSSQYTDRAYFILPDCGVTTLASDRKTISGVAVPTKVIVDREASKLVRVKFRPLLEFTKTYLDVLGFDVPKIEGGSWWDLRSELQEVIEHPEKYNDNLFRAMQVVFWVGQIHATTEAMRKFILKVATIKKEVDLPIGSQLGKRY